MQSLSTITLIIIFVRIIGISRTQMPLKSIPLLRLTHCTEETRRNQTPVFIISIKEKTHALITAQFVNILQDGGVRFILFSALKTKESERKRLQHMLEARTSILGEVTIMSSNVSFLNCDSMLCC
jgi:hypothetical protein